MASVSPSTPILPISSSTTTIPTEQPVSTPTFRLFLSRLSDSLRLSLSHRRPWPELLDRSAFSRPDSLSLAISHLRSNLSYFRINYFLLLALLLALSLLSHPFSLLILLTLFAAWSFLYLFRPSDPPLVILGRQLSDQEIFGGLVLVTILVIFLTSVGSLLISSVMVGAAIVCVHGAFRVPEYLCLEDQEPIGAAAGGLSFLGGAASSAAAAGGPTAAVRV